MKPITLKTKRLVLRQGDDSDAQALFMNYLSSAERSLYLCREPHTHITQTKNFIKQWCELPWKQKHNRFAWVIATAHLNIPIGLFLIDADNDGNIEIHYGITKDHENQGLITEAGVAVIEWLSMQPRVNKIYAHCDLSNIGSQAVLEKFGLKRIGILKSHLTLPAFGPEPRDCLRYELLLRQC